LFAGLACDTISGTLLVLPLVDDALALVLLLLLVLAAALALLVLAAALALLVLGLSLAGVLTGAAEMTGGVDAGRDGVE
jgi:hypothetical protein